MFYNKLSIVTSILLIFTCLTNGIEAKPVKIVTVTEDFASIAKSVGGELVTVSSLIKGSRNLHSINPKPSMIMSVKSADLLIRLGMEQDSWVDDLIQVARNRHIFPNKQGHLDASERIKKLDVPKGKINGNLGDTHKHGNPHYWLNPENGKIIARHIRDRLKLIDPENQSKYDSNYELFVSNLDKKIKEWRIQLNPLSDVHIVTYHKIWPYFFEAFQLKSIGELEALPGIPPTTKHMATLKSSLKESKKEKLVLAASFYPKYVGQSFAKEIGAKFKSLPINVGERNIKSYIALFDYLVEELSQ